LFLRGSSPELSAISPHSIFLSVVPPYIPCPLAVVYIGALSEMFGAIGILLPASRRAAGVGLFLLTLAVTPANVYMWQNPDKFAFFPTWRLTLRLVIQVFLLITIVLSTWPAANDSRRLSFEATN
jgi:uncharacterized membrane protein